MGSARAQLQALWRGATTDWTVLAVSLCYLVATPYTKVEESFGVQVGRIHPTHIDPEIGVSRLPIPRTDAAVAV